MDTHNTAIAGIRSYVANFYVRWLHPLHSWSASGDGGIACGRTSSNDKMTLTKKKMKRKMRQKMIRPQMRTPLPRVQRLP